MRDGCGALCRCSTTTTSQISTDLSGQSHTIGRRALRNILRVGALTQTPLLRSPDSNGTYPRPPNSSRNTAL